MGNSILYGIFSNVLEMSVTAGIIICMVLGIRLCLKGAPRLFCYLLWSVVLFRLLCPVAFVSSLSVFGMWDPTGVQVAAPALKHDIPIHTGQPLEGEDKTTQGAKAIKQGGMDKNETAASSIEAAENTAGEIAAAVWLAGIVCLAGYSITGTLRLKKRLSGAVCITGNIYSSGYIDTPFAMGIFSPKIYLPKYLTQKEQEFIILHEQTHIKRRDPFIKLLAFTALTLHWFNPLVWIAFYAAEKDMEMSCDEAVMKQMKDDIRAEYCTALLNLTVPKTIFHGPPLAFGEGNTKSRVKNVMRYKKPAAFAVCIASVLLIACIIGLGTDPGKKKTDGSGALSLAGTETEDITEKGAQDTETDSPNTEEGALMEGEKRIAAAPDLAIRSSDEVTYLGCFGSKGEWDLDEEKGEQVIYSATADITHDGMKDRIDLMIDTAAPVSSAEEYIYGLGFAYIRAYEGTAEGGFKEDVLYTSGYVAHTHVGNGQIAIARKDGREYLLISNMWEGQGFGGYLYTVLYLDPERKEAVIADEGLVQFEFQEDVSREEEYRREDVAAFRERLNTWTQDADLLISCDVGSEPEVCLSREGKVYRASEYYDAVWERRNYWELE